MAALTSRSDNPVSLAVFKHLRAAAVEPATVGQSTHVMGKGTEGTYDGQALRIGKARWLGVECQPAVQSPLSQNLTVSCATQKARLVAVFGLEATLRDDASTVVARLVERGLAVSIFSGDEIGAVRKVAHTLGISHDAFKARCTRREKQQYVKELVQESNNKFFSAVTKMRPRFLRPVLACISVVLPVLRVTDESRPSSLSKKVP